MGLKDFVKDVDDKGEQTEDKEKEANKKSPDDILDRVRVATFLSQYDTRTGKFRGPDPPKKGEVLQLDPDGEPWHDEWMDLTGGFEYKQDGLVKATKCPCGSIAMGGPRARFLRCSNCSRVLVDLEWEDDRFGNPRNKEETGLEAFM